MESVQMVVSQRLTRPLLRPAPVIPAFMAGATPDSPITTTLARETCNVAIETCTPNPCKNNGACSIVNGAVTCDCTSLFTGSRCETPRQTCGGVSRNVMGHLQFPVSGDTVYQHGLSCAWLLITNSSLVLNVTFTRFDLEDSTDCKFDFLQIHDGRNAGSQMIGRFCGNGLPHGTGNIVSTHNVLYLWFHSDNSISQDGFAFHWNSISPVCGGHLTDDYGTISSPGSPGRYPPDRDCYWTLNVKPTKRIQFHFGLLMLEEHPTCQNDYLEILGEDDERLGLYCNHTRPPPLIVPTSEAVLHFHSDSAGQDSGFQIHYSTVEGITGCSSVYTGPTGTISSPEYMPMNQEYIECEWKIQMPIGEKIQITWIKFALLSTSPCRLEYVQIFDGPTNESPLLGRFCGWTLPPTIKSNSNEVLVIFRTTWSAQMEGFTFAYNIFCGGTFTEESGIIHSPMYPNPYQISRVCTYDIIQPPGNRIMLSLLDVNIETIQQIKCSFDYLEIFDGDSENSTKLASFCNDDSEEDKTFFYSTNNYMLLKFSTDVNFQGRGFMANYTTINTRCGGLLKSPTGTIQSPLEEDNKYYDDENCIWTIQAPPGHVIQLMWLTFDLESQFHCRHDYVKVYENYTITGSHPLGTFCGTKKPPTMMTQGNVMTVEFNTDFTIARDGFVASYLFIDASKVCGGHFIQLTGVIKSPNYPENYAGKRECVWVIEAPNKQKVILNVKKFELENHYNCLFDYLEIRNGGYETSPLIGKYCGTDIPTEIISQTNQLYLKFISDITRSFAGFMIEWDSTTAGCGGILTAANGDIISPNYPQPYMQQLDCYWTISVAAGSLIRLLIVDLDLESHASCRFDYIEISEGINRRNRQKYCGSPYPKVISTESNIVSVGFRSDFSMAGRGFHLKYETLCQNVVHGFYGVIESPNFPNKYEHNLNCSWTIDAPRGNRVNLTFSHFDLEEQDDSCQYDYLKIREGQDGEPNTNIITLCNSDIPPKIHSTQNQVFLTFVTDSLIVGNGFRLEWAVHGCGGHLTKPSDRITSPGYPSGYPMNVECEWLIEVDYFHSIELTIHDINTEKQKGCLFDKLQIISGENEHGLKLVEICYSDSPVVYTSFGNKMFLKFISDITYAAHGFNLSYRSVPLTCGGKFTADTGIIHSTNYPQNYPHRQNCEWLLQVDKNYVINITFLDFDIEHTENCTDDYVQIYDGPTKDSPLMATLCRNDLPPPYVSTANEMLVVMKTDSIISAKGFKAQYTRACGARIIVKDQGYLTPATSYTADGMQKDMNCTWTLIAEDPEDHITVTFTHVEVNVDAIEDDGCTIAFIEIHEGESLDGPSRGKWCDNVIPLPLTSNGNALTVHLYASYDFFGHFAIMYSVLNSACGGTYTSYQGIIASPNYPNTYPLNSECIWILNNSPGNKLTLSFNEFELQKSDNCDLDYLEIREDSGIGKLISVSCGTDIEPVVSSSKLWIKFKSNGEGVAKGFTGSYKFEGGNELSGPSGRITSPLYPHPYKGRDRTTWRITIDFEWVIRLEIMDVFIENSGSGCFSYLRIYDGYDNEAPILLETCNLDKGEPVTTMSNVAFIELYTEVLRLGSWFDLTWLQVPKSEADWNVDVKLSECTKEVGLMDVHNNTYDFTSPGWPDGYDNNLACTWVFTSPPGTHLVFKINTMDLEETSDCTADSLTVYDGNALESTNNARLLQRFCLANSTSSWLKASNVMTVKFESDSYVNETGFSASIYRECGGKLEAPNGVIEMGNMMSLRAHTWQLTCEWDVVVKPGRMIRVDVTEMSTGSETSTSCNDNYLLKNGDKNTTSLLGNGKYCNKELAKNLTTTGNHLYVKVTGGIRLKFKLVYREIGMNCGGTYIATKNLEISTPNYPNIPPPHTECKWSIMAPNGEPISIHFVDRFDLSYSMDCEKEYVEVRDGGTDSSKLLGRFCKDVAPSSMRSTGNMLYIYYYTNVPEPKNGFKATFTVGDVCGGTIRGTSGVISSPNYPHFYQTNLTCIWWIVAATDHSLQLEFRDIHLPGALFCKYKDYVTISESNPENGTEIELGTYCGTTKPEIIETSTNKVQVMFKSGSFHYTTSRGFSLNFTSSIEMCGGKLTAMSGIIKSNEYPNIATRSRYCDWRIELPKGYHVVVDILDMDVSSFFDRTRMVYTISFYNDFRFRSRIKILSQNVTMRQIKSSSNTMMIGYSSSPGHRGFKLRYTGVAPAPCGAVLKDLNGSISRPTVPPFNESSYYCIWSLEAPESLTNNANNTGVTLSILVTGYVGAVWNSPISVRLCYNLQYLSLTGIGTICDDSTQPRYLRSPKPVNELIIVNGTYGKPVNYSVYYRWQPCGGILKELPQIIQSPKNISYPVNCVWYVKYPDTEQTMHIHVTKMNLSSCNKTFLTVKNGGPQSPEVTTFCDNTGSRNLTIVANELWIEYFAIDEPNDFELIWTLTSNTCGGNLHENSRQFSTPGFPAMYGNNVECTWEITAEEGYHVGLVFVDRFSLESSKNCDNDYVQAFDWVKDNGEGRWKSLGKVCGRNKPPPFNSTSNRMKVTFHSNERIESDGFRALWFENCGGVFEVTDTPKVIKSPSYPNFYRPNLNCNYTLITENKDIIVEFMEFQLERSRRDCRFDNLTMISNSMYTSDENVWCGEDKPPIMKSYERVEIIFQTDKYIQRIGFVFKYFLKSCGGKITAPGKIKPLMRGDEYFGGLTCEWRIEAPPDKNVVLRFQSFVLEQSYGCTYDDVEIYDSDDMNFKNRLGKLCGNLTADLPVFKSTNNTMGVHFYSDESRHYGGFSAVILFVKSIEDGCGGNINLTTNEIKHFKTQKGYSYESLEDCHWSVTAPLGKAIKFVITVMDLKIPTHKNITVGKCIGDYLEVRDGPGPFSEIYGTYCGSEVPSTPLVSSSNSFWIRFVSDGTLEGLGAIGTFEVIDGICGMAPEIKNNTRYRISSPNYPKSYGSSVQCRWLLRTHESQHGRIKIRFLDFDIASSARCDEYVQVTDITHRGNVDDSYGQGLIWTGGNPNVLNAENNFPLTSYKYCGSTLPHDFYSYNSEVLVVLKMDSSGHRGFNLEYGKASCDRNHTEEQGRILHEDISDCWITITAPPNHTIALYFNKFLLYDPGECTKSSLQVYDGNFTDNMVAVVCGIEVPSPIFSTGNKLSLHSWSEWHTTYEYYDITYTTTDQGRGCGGRIYNYAGSFTSPLYPNEYRTNAVCTWTVSVPVGLKIVLDFVVFDIGTKNHCENKSNILKLYNIAPNEERLLANTYCGGDDPAPFESISNTIVVTYTSSMNNVGTGWSIFFKGTPN
ncbi:cubilin isoform X2 [Ptiloglossa arizonensis]|uniref:cubilin isoform X2 n=1 Tax=Ptiloglossa arizonensis TaxID=3350558 RepID=UPI003FA1480C